jgi:quinolinate synthase
VNSLPEDKEIIFVPDQHLGRYVAEQTERNFILWPGYCITHIVISEDDIRKARQKYPDAMVLVHPECSEPVKALADRIFSTGQMLKFAGKSGVKRFIIGTETGIIHALKKVNPEAEYIAASEKAVCPNMKRINLEKVLWSLEDNKYKITVPEEIRIRAKNALDRMIQIQV